MKELVLIMAYRSQIEAFITRKACENKNYRQKLLCDAKSVMEIEMGLKLPDAFNYQAVEESATQIYIVLPLSTSTVVESDLAKLAGGCWIAVSSSCDWVTGGYVFVT